MVQPRKKIKNPETGRMVYATGRKGKQILNTYYIKSTKSNRMIIKSGATYKRQKKELERQELERQELERQELEKTPAQKARKLLSDGDIEGAYKLVELREKFTDNDINQFLNIISPMTENHYIMKIWLSNGRIKYLTLKNENLEQFVEALKLNYFEANNGAVHGSESVEQVLHIGIIKIELVKINPTNIFKNKSGSFFRYLNKTDIDLTRYQIIQNEKQKDILNEHCLLYALKLFADIPENLINRIKTKFQKGSHFAKSNLKQVSDIIKKTIILRTIKNNQNKTIKTYFNKNKYQETVCLSLYMNHYFIDEKVNYTVYSTRNYKDIKDIKNFNMITGKNRKKYTKCKVIKKKCDSLRLIYNLFQEGHFEKDNFIITHTAQYQKLNEKNIPLTNIDEEQKLYEFKAKEDQENIIFFADTESDTTAAHEGIMTGVIKMREINTIADTRVYVRQGRDCKKWFTDFLKYVDGNSKGKKAIVYYHNLKYDYHVFLPYLYQASAPTEKDGQIYSLNVLYNARIIEFRDSFKLINFGLKAFNEIFELPEDLNKKEAIAYSYHTVDNMKNTKILMKTYESFLKESEIKIFRENIEQDKKTRNKFKSDEENFNPVAYYKEYLRYDVLVLCEGIKKFKNIIDTLTDGKLNLFNYLTISSLTNAYMGLNGAFDGVYQMCGNLREFVSMAITGGRVQALEETKCKVIEKKIADYDGVSLYSSSIHRLCKNQGLPKGEAKVLNTTSKKDLDKLDYYIIEIKITKINKKQQLPFISHKDENGILQYINKVPNGGVMVVVDTYTLNDWIKYQKIEYEIIRGVYWDCGFNKKMGSVVEKLFADRLKYKESGNNALQEILKLMLNSSYGKTIIKKSLTEKRIIKKKDFDNYVHNYYYLIKDIDQLNDQQYLITVDGIDESYNMAQVGTGILSMSKRIMNEVFDIANNYSLPIYYTDTDSMHCNYDDVAILEKKFFEKYGRELTGIQMGQFHIDFKLKGAKSEIYATKSIFLGKKCYIDVLESKDKDGKTITGVHYRMKGVTVDGLEYHAKKDFDGSMFKLYEHLIENELKVTLNPPGKKPLFEYKNCRVFIRDTGTFYRTIGFTNNN